MELEQPSLMLCVNKSALLSLKGTRINECLSRFKDCGEGSCIAPCLLGTVYCTFLCTCYETVLLFLLHKACIPPWRAQLRRVILTHFKKQLLKIVLWDGLFMFKLEDDCTGVMVQASTVYSCTVFSKCPSGLARSVDGSQPVGDGHMCMRCHPLGSLWHSPVSLQGGLS